MRDDPTIARIRAVRHQISERYHHDAAQLIAHYCELEQRYHDRVVAQVERNRDEKSLPEHAIASDMLSEPTQLLAGNC